MPKLQLALRVARCIAVAFAKAGSAMALGPHLGTLAANGLVEAVPAVAKELWASLRKPKEEGGLTPAELRTAVGELAAADADEAAALAAAAVDAEAAAIPAAQREAVLTYLREVPATIRRSMRRPEDPSGRTVPAYQSFAKAEDLAALLPARLPRMREGQEVHGLVLRRLLGSGGYGEVWEASPAGVPGAESVAIKFCTDERARRQLLDHEAKVVAQVMSVGRHPGIVRLLRKHLADELPSLEYEFVAGGDLQAHLSARWADGKAWSVDDAVALFAEIVAPFAHMHAANPPIVHRDAKLANILVDALGRMRVTDFGIGGLAFATEEVAMSRRGAVTMAQFSAVARGAYTPNYASREQMQGDDAHPADDVYSLGVIFYQLLTKRLGEPAPSGDWDEELREAGVSGPVIDVLKKSLSRRERRFATAGLLLQRVEALRPAQKVVAVPATPRVVPAPAVAAPPKKIATSIGLDMLHVPAQEFWMGSPESEAGRKSDERRHRVRITRDFWLGETPVTQAMWRQVMKTEPWKGNPLTQNGDRVAVTFVSATDAESFCARLTAMERAAGRLAPGLAFLLPTEAQWEVACRAGSEGAYCFGDDVGKLRDCAIFRGARDGAVAHAVKLRRPNALGFYDMHGNVWEWCADRDKARGAVSDSYVDGAVDPEASGGPLRVFRGGSWNASAQDCRSASRLAYEPGTTSDFLGFRPALAARSDVKQGR